MKRILMILGVMAVCTSAFAQAPSDPTERATMAAPANLRDGATVIKWKSDFTYDTVRKGTNKLVCYDRSGFPEQLAFSIECTSTADNLPRVAQNMKLEALGDKAKTQAALDAAEKDGSRVKPVYGSVWYHAMGADDQHIRMHVTIAMPNATTSTTGIPDNPAGASGGIWLMNAGTTTAHIMTPGE
jgi:hypothetical protein